MKLYLPFLLVIGSFWNLCGQPTVALQDEASVLMSLMESTKKTLEQQQHLFKLVMEFKKAKEFFIQEPTSAKLATHLVRCASLVYVEIEKLNLSHLFSEEFLVELRFFTQVALEQAPTKGLS